MGRGWPGDQLIDGHLLRGLAFPAHFRYWLKDVGVEEGGEKVNGDW